MTLRQPLYVEEYTGFSQSLQSADCFPFHTYPSVAWNKRDVPTLWPLTLSPTVQWKREWDWNKTCTSYIYRLIFLELPSRFSNKVGEQCICSVPGRILPLADVFLGRIFCGVCFFLFKPVADGSPVWFHLAIPLLLYCLLRPLHSHSMGQFLSFLMHNCHSYSES